MSESFMVYPEINHMKMDITINYFVILSVPKFTANVYCICLSIPQIYT